MPTVLLVIHPEKGRGKIFRYYAITDHNGNIAPNLIQGYGDHNLTHFKEPISEKWVKIENLDYIIPASGTNVVNVMAAKVPKLQDVSSESE